MKSRPLFGLHINVRIQYFNDESNTSTSDYNEYLNISFPYNKSDEEKEKFYGDVLRWVTSLLDEAKKEMEEPKIIENFRKEFEDAKKRELEMENIKTLEDALDYIIAPPPKD